MMQPAPCSAPPPPPPCPTQHAHTHAHTRTHARTHTHAHTHTPPDGRTPQLSTFIFAFLVTTVPFARILTWSWNRSTPFTATPIGSPWCSSHGATSATAAGPAKSTVGLAGSERWYDCSRGEYGLVQSWDGVHCPPQPQVEHEQEEEHSDEQEQEQEQEHEESQPHVEHSLPHPHSAEHPPPPHAEHSLPHPHSAEHPPPPHAEHPPPTATRFVKPPLALVSVLSVCLARQPS